MSALRILVADDHEVVRRGLCALLKSHAGWEVCAEAVDGREAVHQVNQLKPDIVILDIGMPNLNGLTAARQILHAHPQQKILILTISDAEQIVREVLNAGARGFVLKSPVNTPNSAGVSFQRGVKPTRQETVSELLTNASAGGFEQ